MAAEQHQYVSSWVNTPLDIRPILSVVFFPSLVYWLTKNILEPLITRWLPCISTVGINFDNQLSLLWPTSLHFTFTSDLAVFTGCRHSSANTRKGLHQSACLSACLSVCLSVRLYAGRLQLLRLSEGSSKWMRTRPLNFTWSLLTYDVTRKFMSARTRQSSPLDVLQIVNINTHEFTLSIAWPFLDPQAVNRVVCIRYLAAAYSLAALPA